MYSVQCIRIHVDVYIHVYIIHNTCGIWHDTCTSLRSRTSMTQKWRWFPFVRETRSPDRVNLPYPLNQAGSLWKCPRARNPAFTMHCLHHDSAPFPELWSLSILGGLLALWAAGFVSTGRMLLRLRRMLGWMTSRKRSVVATILACVALYTYAILCIIYGRNHKSVSDIAYLTPPYKLWSTVSIVEIRCISSAHLQLRQTLYTQVN